MSGALLRNFLLFGRVLSPAAGRPPPLQEPPTSAVDASAAGSDEPPVIQATLTYSQREVLRHKGFGDLSAGELEAVTLLMSEIVCRVQQRRSAARKRKRRPVANVSDVERGGGRR